MLGRSGVLVLLCLNGFKVPCRGRQADNVRGRVREGGEPPATYRGRLPLRQPEPVSWGAGRDAFFSFLGGVEVDVSTIGAK